MILTYCIPYHPVGDPIHILYANTASIPLIYIFPLMMCTDCITCTLHRMLRALVVLSFGFLSAIFRVWMCADICAVHCPEADHVC